MESVSRICFALAVAVGIAERPDGGRARHRRRAVRLAGRRAGGVRATRAERAPASGELRAAATRPARWRRSPSTRPTRRSRDPATEGVQEAAAHDDLSLRRGGGFAMSVSGIMLSEQTLLNAAVLTVDATSRNARAGRDRLQRAADRARAAAAVPGDPDLAAAAPRRASRRRPGHAAFARAIRVTVLAIAAFAARGRARPARGRPVRAAPRVLRPALHLQPLRARADRRRHGPAPVLRRAQPGRARARPRARRRRLLGCCAAVAVRRLDAARRRSANSCCAPRSATPARPRCWRSRSPRSTARAPQRGARGAADVSAPRPTRRSRGRPRRDRPRRRSPSRRRTRSRRPARQRRRGVGVDAAVDLDRDVRADDRAHARRACRASAR